MSEKRKRPADPSDSRAAKKTKHGFRVGPQNLPDGSYRRKAQKIKSALIERAQIKKNYAKLKRQADASQTVNDENGEEEEDDDHPARPDPSTTPHPDRQALMADDGPVPESRHTEQDHIHPSRRPRRPKAAPFQREVQQAEKRKAEAEERRKAREEAERQRQLKIEERERFRRAMAKAKSSGPNGQRKLGRESKVLLERVKKLVGEGS